MSGCQDAQSPIVSGEGTNVQLWEMETSDSLSYVVTHDARWPYSLWERGSSNTSNMTYISIP